MPEYTVKDTQTGKTVTFRWDGTEPPTDDDMADVFTEARGQTEDAPAAPLDTAVETPDNSSSGMAPAIATGAAYLAGSVLPRALPFVNKAASYVAGSPGAQRAVGTALGAAVGIGTKTDMALDALVGGSMKDLVGQGAAKLARLTQGARATVGRAANGRFTKLLPSRLPSVLENLGRSMGMISGEGAALEQMNTPEAIQQIKDTYRMPTR